MTDVVSEPRAAAAQASAAARRNLRLSRTGAGIRRLVQHWNLREIDAPDGTRDPVVLRSDGEGRAVLIAIGPGQELGDHQVKESAWITVVDGRVRVSAETGAVDAETGALFRFDPDERHSLASVEGARILLFLAPFPGAGHYRGHSNSERR